MIDHLTTRRAALADQIAEGKARYTEVETMLRDLQRAIDMDVGALRMLDELIAEAERSPIAIDGLEVVDG